MPRFCRSSTSTRSPLCLWMQRQAPRPSINEVTKHAVAMQRQVPRFQISAKTVEVPPAQPVGTAVNVLAIKQARRLNTSTCLGAPLVAHTDRRCDEANAADQRPGRSSRSVYWNRLSMRQCRRFWKQPLRPSTHPLPGFWTTSMRWSSSLPRHTPMIPSGTTMRRPSSRLCRTRPSGMRKKRVHGCS